MMPLVFSQQFKEKIMITLNDTIPDIPLYHLKEGSSTPISSLEILKGKCLLFAIPGAFTKTCSSIQVPSFIENKERFHKLGITSLICMAVNDPYTLEAWAQVVDPLRAIQFISDGNYEFSKAIGMLNHLERFGMGIRSRRYAMLLDDYKVKLLQVDEVGAGCILSHGNSFYEEVENYFIAPQQRC